MITVLCLKKKTLAPYNGLARRKGQSKERY
ncbi:hypothetical protein SAMN04490205_0351 [Pseudomonas trivialis]|uniref:Transposase n=1 Tax=Pseudomonas trivialis TaxID=200450 RepID=A0ABY0TYF3_9PSED|nr:hypothetical protein SAMN04490205_0351 [Pseudomonas trivialis]